jgi:DNA-binding MarR family transcriptional regulator
MWVKTEIKYPFNRIEDVFQLFVEIHITQMLATAELSRVMPYELTISQFSLLSHFSRFENLERNIVELAGIFQVTKSSMGETVNKLRNKGFINVETNSSDRRGKIVSLTKKGALAKIEAEKSIYVYLESMTEHLGTDQLESAYHALKPIRIWMDNNRT